MNEGMRLLLATVAGLLLGAFFFGGLWWTVQRGLTRARPALWFIGSLLLRMGVTVMGFLLVGDGHWQRLALCMAGFIVARWIVHGVTRTTAVPSPHPSQQAPHAP